MAKLEGGPGVTGQAAADKKRGASFRGMGLPPAPAPGARGPELPALEWPGRLEKLGAGEGQGPQTLGLLKCSCGRDQEGNGWEGRRQLVMWD